MTDTDQGRSIISDAAYQALMNCVTDLATFPGDKGVALLVADRLTRLSRELKRES